MGKRTNWTRPLFIQTATELHAGKYDYSKVNFETINGKVEVLCSSPTHSGETVSFFPVAGDHLRKKTGCPRCKAVALADRVRAERGITQTSFLTKAKEVHGDKYDYSKSVIRRAVDPVEVICPQHGSFFPTPQNHLNSGTGCPECGKEIAREKRVLPIEEFILRSSKLHDEKYDYSKVAYTKLHDFITVICPEHGEFEQIAYDHLAGHGCSKCQSTISQPQLEIKELLGQKGIRCELEARLGGWQVDIFCPDLRVGIEYNGLRWHSEAMGKTPQHHLIKTTAVNEAGVHLIHIWEDDWLFDREKTLKWLMCQVGKSATKYNARDLVVQRIAWSEAEPFVKEHHMQGQPSPCEHCYALKDTRGTLRAVMLLSSKTRKGSEGREVCLERFCSDGVVRGGFSKLLRHFLRDNEGSFDRIISFSDRSWSKGDVYLKNGFTLEGHSVPRYWWVKNQRRYDRRGFQRKLLKTRLQHFNPDLSEAENCYANGFYKLYDCGISKWVLKL
jgi:very-short-patch-repair endonuclease